MTLTSLRLLIADGFLLIFTVLLIFGLWGMIRFKTTSGRILNSSKIDSVAVIFLMCGLMLRANSLNVTLKLLTILVFYMITNPVVNQLIAYSAKKAMNERSGG